MDEVKKASAVHRLYDLVYHQARTPTRYPEQSLPGPLYDLTVVVLTLGAAIGYAFFS